MTLIVFLLLLSTSAVLGQQQPTKLTCPATEKAILDLYQVQHQAFYKRDFVTFARVVDDQAIINYDDGRRRSKNEAVAAIKQEQSGDETADDGPMEDTVVKFEDGVAILTFEQGFRNLDLDAGFSTTGSARESYIFGCRGGEWKIIFRAETPVPNAHRAPDISVLSHLDDYVGISVFTRMGTKGTSTSSERGTNSLRAQDLTKRTNSFPEGLILFLCVMTLRSSGSSETRTAKSSESIMSFRIRILKQDAWGTDFPVSVVEIRPKQLQFVKDVVIRAISLRTPASLSLVAMLHQPAPFLDVGRSHCSIFVPNPAYT